MTIKEMIKFLELLENNNEVVVELRIKKVAKEAPKADNATTSQNSAPAKEDKKSTYKSFKDLPAGVKAEKRGNRYIAVETEKGALYTNRQILKEEFGFQWNANEKVWEKIIPTK